MNQSCIKHVLLLMYSYSHAIFLSQTEDGTYICGGNLQGWAAIKIFNGVVAARET
jgi:hypothetical protein